MDWLQAFGFDRLTLYFEVACEGLDGECFHYNVYFTEPMTEEKCEAIHQALRSYFAAHYPQDDSEDNYTGDLFSFPQDDHFDIELDLGNVRPDQQFQNGIIQAVLLALNDVPGIREVIVNEGCEDYM